jgi:cytochrome c oxidase subunit 3
VAHERVMPAHQFDDLEQQREAGSLGMWVFLATEVMVFGALFAGYVAFRSANPEAFAEASRQLNVLIGGINTVVLLASSLTMALAVQAAQLGKRQKLISCLVLTALLGTMFMVLKAVEYYLDYRDDLVPNFAFKPGQWLDRGVNPERVQLFLLFYYIMTGLHALHLTIGIGVLVVIAFMAWRGSFSPEHYGPVEVTGLYWHFVDVIWIFLLPLLYLIGTRH